MLCFSFTCNYLLFCLLFCFLSFNIQGKFTEEQDCSQKHYSGLKPLGEGFPDLGSLPRMCELGVPSHNQRLMDSSGILISRSIIKYIPFISIFMGFTTREIATFLCTKWEVGGRKDLKTVGTAPVTSAQKKNSCSINAN